MKFSSRSLGAISAVVLLTSGVALLAAGPASALPTRLEGPFLTTSAVGSKVFNTWNEFRAGQPITLQKEVKDALGAAVISFPKPGTTGVIQGTGAASDLCITAATSLVPFAATTAQVCDGSPRQQWSITADGQMLFAGDQSFGLSDYTGDNSVRMVSGSSAPQAWDAIVITTAAMAPIVAPLTAEVVSQDDDGRSAVISGSGEPGAIIVIKPGENGTVTVDPDGHWTATIQGLTVGSNQLQIVQQIDGQNYGATWRDVVIAAPPVSTPESASPGSTPSTSPTPTGAIVGPRVETGGSTVDPELPAAAVWVVGGGVLAALGIWFAAHRSAQRRAQQ